MMDSNQIASKTRKRVWVATGAIAAVLLAIVFIVASDFGGESVKTSDTAKQNKEEFKKLKPKVIDNTRTINRTRLINGQKGSLGERGPFGERGTAGTIGTPGEDGPTGPVGADGPAGKTGPAGNAGPETRGADGAEGKDGVNGKDGSPGVDGSPGANGARGETGPAPAGFGTSCFVPGAGPATDPDGDLIYECAPPGP